jgi:DNA-binding transcriptional ArsR family regulator
MNSDQAKRQAALERLGLERPVLAGSLNEVRRTDKNGRTTTYWLLTSKEAGKTKSVYVPKDLVKEVRSWIRNYRKLKNQIARVSDLSVAVIRGHVRDARDAAAKPRPEKRNT